MDEGCPITELNLGGETCEKQRYTFAGNPINVATGNKYQKEVDLNPGLTPMSVEFVRHYNSQSEAFRSLGYGWSHTYDCYLSFAADKIVSWREDGRAIYFSAATLLPESGANGQLSYNQSEESYTLTRTDDLKETYDSSGRLMSITDLNGNTQTLIYDSNGELEAVTDPFGRSLSFTYHGSGRLETLTDPAGRTIFYDYDVNGNLIQVTYPDGGIKTYHYEDTNDIYNLTGITNENGVRYATFAYDEKDRAVLSTNAGDADKVTVDYESATSTVTDVRGNSTAFKLLVKDGIGLAEELTGPGCSGCGSSGSKSYTYDDNLNVASVTDEKGITTNYAYDAQGNMLSRTEAVGTDDERITTYTYVPGLREIASITQKSVKSGEDKVTTFDYDGSGNLIQKTETGYAGEAPFSHATNYQYNASGQITQVDGARSDVSDVITFTYDTQGNLTSVTRGESLTTAYSDYDGYGSPGRIIDPNGVVTVLGYDERNRLQSITTSAGTTSYIYDLVGNLTRVELPNGNLLFYSYDEVNRLIQVADGLGNSITYGYDALGNRTEERTYDPSGNLSRSLSYEYDAFNRPFKVIYPDNAFETFTYDGNGNRTSAIDANGYTTSYIYDSLNRIKQVNQLGDVVTRYTHDAADNLTSVTDAEGHLTAYTYDDAGRIVNTVSPDTGATYYSYDEAGNLTAKTDARSITVTYTYDSLNRLTKVDYPNDPDVIYTYDEGEYGKDRLTGMTDASGSSVFVYDAVGNLIREEKSIEGITYTTEYRYDPAGQLTGITYPGGRVVSYELDQAGRVVRATSSKEGETVTLAENISYLPFGPLSGLRYGNGIRLSQSFDQRYRFTGLDAEGVMDLGYVQDALGNITEITNHLDATRSQSFSYDPLNRLITATGTYGDLSYTLDFVGNRLSKIYDDQGDTYTYTTRTNLLQAISGVDSVAFSYDANGNTTAVGSKVFRYSDNNRLIQALVDGSVVGEYVYNGRGQRVIKRAGDETVIYHYDLQGQLIAETDPGGGVLREYFYLGDRLLAAVHKVVSPLRSIESAADRIEDLIGQDKELDKSLEKILLHLQGALKDHRGTFWLDEFHLVSRPRGAEVFKHLDQVIKELGKQKLNKLAPELGAVLEEMARDLVEAAQILARICYEETQAGAEGNADQEIQTLLSHAKSELESAEELINDGNGGQTGSKSVSHAIARAIDHLRLAWHFSQLVMQQARISAPLMRVASVSSSVAAFDEYLLTFVHADHLGTPLKLTDDTGRVVWKVDYYPFGDAIVDEDPDGDRQTVSFNFRFPGQYLDQETGLHYNYQRYYDPGTGRYLTPDPIGLAAGVNLYSYVLNNPIIYTDPFGLELKFDILKEAAKVASTNPEAFIEALRILAQDPKYNVLRTGREPYEYLVIADDWCDIPESVSTYSTGIWWKDVASTFGSHYEEKRFLGGYHIHTDMPKGPVRMHFDAYDPMKNKANIWLHIEIEYLKLDPLPDFVGP